MSLHKPKNTQNWMSVIVHRGKTFRKSMATPDRAEAEKLEAEFRELIKGGKNLAATTTVRDALADYKKSKEGTTNAKNLPRDIVLIEDFFKPLTPLHEIDTPSVTRFVAQLRKTDSNSTIKHRLQTIRSSISLARDHGYQVPDIRYPKLKTVRGRTRVMSQDEIQAVLNELHPDKQAEGWIVGEEAKRFRQDAFDIWMLGANTGARFGEIGKLEWSQVDLAGRTILLYRSKVDNETRLSMTEAAYEVLARRNRERLHPQYVFPNRKMNGPRINIGKAIRHAIKRAGLKDVSFHVNRHTVCTRLLEGGMNLQAVAHIAGHATLQTTMRYVHVSTQRAAQDAAAILNKKVEPKLTAVK